MRTCWAVLYGSPIFTAPQVLYLSKQFRVLLLYIELNVPDLPRPFHALLYSYERRLWRAAERRRLSSATKRWLLLRRMAWCEFRAAMFRAGRRAVRSCFRSWRRSTDFNERVTFALPSNSLALYGDFPSPTTPPSSRSSSPGRS